MSYNATTADELAAILQNTFALALQGVIAIDGKDGVGKSPLAAGLRERIGGTVISVDDHIDEAQGVYVPALRVSDLRGSLAGAAAPQIVEGVCLLNVLQAIDCKSAVHVYVRRLSAGRYWRDEVICDPSEPVADTIAREVASLRQFAEAKASISGKEPPAPDSIRLTPLREEIIRYHASVLPFRTADIVVSLEE
jgi:hypothetical protein